MSGRPLVVALIALSAPLAIGVGGTAVAIAPTVLSVEASPIGVALLLVGGVCLTAALALPA